MRIWQIGSYQILKYAKYKDNNLSFIFPYNFISGSVLVSFWPLLKEGAVSCDGPGMAS